MCDGRISSQCITKHKIKEDGSCAEKSGNTTEEKNGLKNTRECHEWHNFDISLATYTVIFEACIFKWEKLFLNSLIFIFQLLTFLVFGNTL